MKVKVDNKNKIVLDARFIMHKNSMEVVINTNERDQDISYTSGGANEESFHFESTKEHIDSTQDEFFEDVVTLIAENEAEQVFLQSRRFVEKAKRQIVILFANDSVFE